MYLNIFFNHHLLKILKTFDITFFQIKPMYKAISSFYLSYVFFLVIFLIIQTRKPKTKFYDCLEIHVFIRVKLRKYIFKSTHHCCMNYKYLICPSSKWTNDLCFLVEIRSDSYSSNHNSLYKCKHFILLDALFFFNYISLMHFRQNS